MRRVKTFFELALVHRFHFDNRDGFALGAVVMPCCVSGGALITLEDDRDRNGLEGPAVTRF